jgi:hypothetical protein
LLFCNDAHEYVHLYLLQVPITLRLLVREEDFVRGPFHLGRWSKPIAVVAFCWAVFACIMFILPPVLPVTLEVRRASAAQNCEATMMKVLLEAGMHCTIKDAELRVWMHMLNAHATWPMTYQRTCEARLGVLNPASSRNRWSSSDRFQGFCLVMPGAPLQDMPQHVPVVCSIL